MSTQLEEAVLQGTFEHCIVEDGTNVIEAMSEKICQLNAGDKAKIGNVLSTAKNYVAIKNILQIQTLETFV